MADNTNNIKWAIETNQAFADTMLSSLPWKVVNHGKHAVAWVLAWLAMAVSSPAFADTTPTALSTSATLQSTGIASNGMKFADMEKMSPEEMNKLSPKVQEELEAWMEQKLQQGKQAVVSLEAANEWKRKENLSLEIANEWKKQVLIKQQFATLDQFIWLIEKGGTNTEIYKQLKEDFKKIILSKKPPEVIEKINTIPGLAEKILQA